MSSAILAGLWLWYAYDEARTESLARQYKPVPLPKDPTYFSSDVSIIIPTIDTPDTFTNCLRLWLANKPKEILVVTIDRDYQHVQDLIKPVKAEGDDRIQLITVDRANKRSQLVAGMKKATGKIIAMVDDDAFWGSVELIPHLLAPFEDPKVGGVVGKQSAHIPQDRRNPAIATPWEIASLRSLDNQNKIQAVRFAADRGCFCLVGRTLLTRAEIAKDPRFLHAITHEYWRGKHLNTGDDVFVTRWLQTEGWDLSIQNCPEAELTTHVMQDAKLLRQLVRWQRNSIQSFLRTLVDKPGIVKVWQKHPYMTRKLIERLLRPVIAWIHIFAFIEGFRQNSMIAYFCFFWYVWEMFSSYSAFVERYPWAYANIWAAVLLDNCHPILDPYAWFTLGTEAWGTRNESS
ncbi:N-acetylglucosaminyltransferase [Colletotrichum plurivorum]|uniref:N-acetylglucosaminyltransferase n=1 Tax=Colletotrichum plurivorum TaxID=2175906 RepID=A0A8H6K1U5_9PEZI|nr:N-acetylglucosaminyltransferase [Colletotrichum plurivorum]